MLPFWLDEQPELQEKVLHALVKQISFLQTVDRHWRTGSEMLAGALCGHLHVLVSSFLLVLNWGGVCTLFCIHWIMEAVILEGKYCIFVSFLNTRTKISPQFPSLICSITAVV